MATQAEIKREDILKSPGTAQLFVTDEVATGLNIAPKLNKITQKGRRYNFYKRDATSKQIYEEFFKDEPMDVTKGAQLMEVSGSEQVPDSVPLFSKGFRYIVIKEDYDDSPESFLLDIEDMCYVISATIEKTVRDAVVAAAVAAGIKAALHDGPWDDSTEIAEDLRGFKADMRTRGIKGTLDQLFYKEQYDELGNYIIRTEGIQNLKEEGDVITYGSIENIYAENGPQDGETFGWPSAAKPGAVVYRTIPGAYTPIKTKPGTEDYLPVINMKIIESDGEGLDPIYDIRFGAHWQVPIMRENNIFYQNGL